MNPFWLFDLLGCCQDPPISVAQPNWWEDLHPPAKVDGVARAPPRARQPKRCAGCC
ncbi:UNVERIFIED_CONTAM: hypothetical protein HHA_451180 [Hammondia hammondi]|eukprot:XP_008883898.1 hypothetical protein HHA_451180 [Hammondia hammondi]